MVQQAATSIFVYLVDDHFFAGDGMDQFFMGEHVP